MANQQVRHFRRPSPSQAKAQDTRAKPPLSRKPTNEKHTPEQIVAALKRSQGMISVASRQLGCQRQTIYNMMARHPDIEETVSEERDMMLDTAELKLGEAVEKGEQWAICFYLKTQGRKRGYSEKRELDVEGKLTLEQILKAAYDERAKRTATERCQSSHMGT